METTITYPIVQLNSLNPSLIDDYNSGKITLPGNGIEIISGENNTIENNEISNFKNGIYLENSKNTTIQNNTITKNNYGIEFGENVSATTIQSNKINDNIGLITLEVVEGPLGYGISIRDSGVDVNILNNEINNNYMRIFIDAKNCSGIKITGNSISNNTIEGLTFNENYTFAEGSPEVIVENNAIYNNAKGPSMIILGEVSANPAGIYGPGEWDDTKKLYLRANWYGTNKYTT
ncbi:MAG: right-handed parallel beta-helix repeat-containing protein [Methanobrevibacter sp.]|uniref:right-handed parallel beta-helix repeat-containing protein n=1 Tax=Methanobrevibacter sp. TaxID=66852 RepID=UPI0026E07FF5|nr:right-handed parallel beta-helix repeat-containing protein [Methanobrevibacter sp.]MDO5848579.1 right-handed parallel beta-helix repeat-containing protein [Methanobrevibacter sp.]